MVKTTNTSASTKALKKISATQELIDNLGVVDELDNNGVAKRRVYVNKTNVDKIDTLFVDYATKLSKDKRKNATKLLQLVEMSNKLTSNTIKKRIYAQALLNEVKMLPRYDRHEKAYTSVSVRISVAQLAKTCYNLIVFENNSKNGNNTTTSELVK